MPEGLDESLKLDFSTPYGCSKGSADQYVKDWSRVFGLKTVVFRPPQYMEGGNILLLIKAGSAGSVCKALKQEKSKKMEIQ